jgi:hypothetical protein
MFTAYFETDPGDNFRASRQFRNFSLCLLQLDWGDTCDICSPIVSLIIVYCGLTIPDSADRDVHVLWFTVDLVCLN